MSKIPNKIRVHANVDELQQNTKFEGAEGRNVASVTNKLVAADAKFVELCDKIVAKKTNATTDDVLALLQLCTEIAIGAGKVDQFFTFDKVTNQLFMFEGYRWRAIDSILTVAHNVTDKEFTQSQAKALLSAISVLPRLKQQHVKLYQDLKPDRKKSTLVTAERAEVEKATVKTKLPASTPRDTVVGEGAPSAPLLTPTQSSAKVVKDLILAAKLVAEASMSSLHNYDKALELLKSVQPALDAWIAEEAPKLQREEEQAEAQRKQRYDEDKARYLEQQATEKEYADRAEFFAHDETQPPVKAAYVRFSGAIYKAVDTK